MLRQNPPSKDSLQKIPHGKLSFFCIHWFSKTKCKSTKTIMQWCFSCQNKPVCQKLAWSCKTWKSAQTAIYAFLHRSLQFLFFRITAFLLNWMELYFETYFSKKTFDGRKKKISHFCWKNLSIILKFSICKNNYS